MPRYKGMRRALLLLALMAWRPGLSAEDGQAAELARGCAFLQGLSDRPVSEVFQHRDLTLRAGTQQVGTAVLVVRSGEPEGVAYVVRLESEAEFPDLGCGRATEESRVRGRLRLVRSERRELSQEKGKPQREDRRDWEVRGGRVITRPSEDGELPEQVFAYPDGSILAEGQVDWLLAMLLAVRGGPGTYRFPVVREKEGVTLLCTVKDGETVLVGTEQVPAIRVDQEYSDAQGVQTFWIGADGGMLGVASANPPVEMRWDPDPGRIVDTPGNGGDGDPGWRARADQAVRAVCALWAESLGESPEGLAGRLRAIRDERKLPCEAFSGWFAAERAGDAVRVSFSEDAAFLLGEAPGRLPSFLVASEEEGARVSSVDLPE